MLGPLDALPVNPRRIAIGGVSGAGKAVLARRIARILNLPLGSDEVGLAAIHGDHWVVTLRDGAPDVEVASAADTLVWLEPNVRVKVQALLRRRSLLGVDELRTLEAAAEEAHPHLQSVRLTSRHDVEQFVFAIGTHRADALG